MILCVYGDINNDFGYKSLFCVKKIVFIYYRYSSRM